MLVIRNLFLLCPSGNLTVYGTDLQFYHYLGLLFRMSALKIFSQFYKVLCIVVPHDVIFPLISCLAYDPLLIPNHRSLDSISYGIFFSS